MPDHVVERNLTCNVTICNRVNAPDEAESHSQERIGSLAEVIGDFPTESRATVLPVPRVASSMVELRTFNP